MLKFVLYTESTKLPIAMLDASASTWELVSARASATRTVRETLLEQFIGNWIVSVVD